MRKEKAASDEGLSLVWLFVLVLAAAGLITAALLHFYQAQKALVRQRVIENLRTMVDYKAILIKRWYMGAMDDARRTVDLPIIQHLIDQGPPGDSGTRAHFREDLAEYALSHGFEASGLVDSDGRWIAWSVGGTPSMKPTLPIALPKGRRSKPVLTDFSQDDAGRAYLDVIVMLSSRPGPAPRPAAVVLVVNPLHNIFRFLSPYPRNRHARTSIIQQVGKTFEYVIPTQTNSIHTLDKEAARMDRNTPEAQSIGALIVNGVGHDARGQKVFYATNYIPWVHWGIVGTMPQSQGYSALRLAAQFTFALIILILLLASALLYALWNRRHRVVTARLAADLAVQKERLEVALKKLYTAVEAERRHLSHELHDELAQLLSTAQMHLFAVSQTLGGQDTGEAKEQLEFARNRIAKAGTECRKVIANLRPPELDDLGLLGAITALGRAMDGPALDIQLEDSPRFRSLPGEISMVLYRITQEALGNAKKHSGASRVSVDLHFDGPFISLRIADDGRGFDPTSSRRVLHFGLESMRERAFLVGGDFDIKSSPGKGTCITVRIPFVEPETTGRDDDTTEPMDTSGFDSGDDRAGQGGRR